jgi:hypothetical protein
MSNQLKPEFQRPKTTQWLRPFVLFMGGMAILLPCRALQVSPTYQTFEARPGQSVKGSMTLTNNELDSVTLTPAVKEWFRLTENENFPVEKWMKLDDSREFTLAAGESKTISYRMTVPKKAKGELVGAVTFSTKPGANMLVLQLSVVQYLGIKGSENLDMEIANIGVAITTETKVAVFVTNTGNVHIRPRGYIYVNDLKGKRVANVEITTGHPTFPGDGRVYSGTVRRYRMPPGSYEAQIELSDVDRRKDYPVKKLKFNVLADGKIEIQK